jgi:hypothetical protein
MITIRFYQDTDKEEWDSYVLKHPNGTFFHFIGWKTVIERTFRHKSYYLIAENNGDTATSQHRDTSIERENSITKLE